MIRASLYVSVCIKIETDPRSTYSLAGRDWFMGFDDKSARCKSSTLLLDKGTDLNNLDKVNGARLIYKLWNE